EQVQVLGVGDVDEEEQHHEHVGPPEDGGQRRRGLNGDTAPGFAEDCTEEGPVSAPTGDVGEDLEEEDGDKYQANQADEDKGIAHAVVLACELLRADDHAPVGELENGQEGQEDKDIEENGEGAARYDGQRDVEDAFCPEIERVNLDDEKAPEGEEVSDAG